MKFGKNKLSGEISIEYPYNGERGVMNLPSNDSFHTCEDSHIMLENIEELKFFVQFIKQVTDYAYKEGHIDYEIQINKRK